MLMLLPDGRQCTVLTGHIEYQRRKYREVLIPFTDIEQRSVRLNVAGVRKTVHFQTVLDSNLRSPEKS